MSYKLLPAGFGLTVLLSLMNCATIIPAQDKSPSLPVVEGLWEKEKANAWYAQQPWLVGCNFIPSTAINQLEMWQAETFDPATIDRELGYAKGLGFNSVRIFLHDLLWQQDSAGFLKRIDEFLKIADKHGIKTMFVLFDSCWHPLPKLGPQPKPLPFTHNSGWVQNPGIEVLKNPDAYPHVKQYVQGVVARYANDPRVVVWDVWNEPDNFDGGHLGRPGIEPKNKPELVNALLPDVFKWVREAKPSQPLTSAVWLDSHVIDRLYPTKVTQLSNSDVVSYHCYGDAESMKLCIKRLGTFGRPLLCTEYMARPNKSTFEPHLAIMKESKVAAYMWGFVNGKSQTIFPWDSWEKKYTAEPPIWFHDVLRADGTAYLPDEVRYIRSVTGK
jgi:Cellulase (glycosyl hydrolase family 5)